MSTTLNYDETIASKWEDIRSDGPGIYSSILELTDNSIDWGNADFIEFSFDKLTGIFKQKDNGPNGFVSPEALHRFFTLGEKNGGVTSVTIGKYGKGGFKACINISTILEIISYFNGESYRIGTNFNDMQISNSSKPTKPLKIIGNEHDNEGSEITLQLSATYQNIYDESHLERCIIRAYHAYDKKVSLKIKGKVIIPSNFCPYKDYEKKVVYKVYYDRDTHVFTSELFDEQLEEDPVSDEDIEDIEETTNKNRIVVGTIELYVLSKLLKQTAFLGDKPGIDIYRNNRLCNTKNPLTGIGGIGHLLTAGQMRGNRCHMVFRYKNAKISETREMDNIVGLSTWKEIDDDAKEFDETLLKILQDKATECSKLYEEFTDKRKDEQMTQINNDTTRIQKLLKLPDTELVKDGTNLNLLNDTYNNLLNFKASYFDNDELVYKYCTSAAQAKKMKQEKTATVIRINSEIYGKSEAVKALLTTLMKKKNVATNNETKIKKIQKEHNLDRDKAMEYIYNENGRNDVKKKIAEASKCDNIETQKAILLDAKKISINDEALSVELEVKLSEVIEKENEQKIKEEESENQRILEDEKYENQRLLEEEKAENQRLLEKEEAEKLHLLEEEEAEKLHHLEEEEEKEKYKNILMNIHNQDDDVIYGIIQDWLEKNASNYKESMNIVKLIAESLL
jgi:hypothetical protein